ncbi:hypothetical protein ND861_11185 [Leptospira sp. 2 VSF19]|uniref:Lipoprotein n=1 Tax=Leptospira soteropolitanensis TaxID=2950025 RepID=A0AAW5VK73_9LEPT|nr:hypothetical protein [Leptospira soteropolitanensis]MCW7493133.1 hypothetical protein [Leptospira soteropolitanensis]MCW7500798.1 hypothetical protein [Leptospira soteropolitanensis]MCW7522983.1 hypothetical protein [Leptospira soteropolitanensis]MCW7526910.1 hypothetical protein [Leptospira soteropolitanensis]MCW7530701.1 hypothetical protein [Leptospira soteropolitanensis]
MNHFFISLLVLALFFSCAAPKSDNLCDAENSRFIPNLLIRFLAKDNSYQCGYKINSNPPACDLSYEETHYDANWPSIQKEMESQFALGSGPTESLVQYRPELVSTVLGISPSYPAFQGALNAPNGSIYFPPYYSPKILEVNTYSKTYSSFGTFSGSVELIGGALGPAGVLYFAPHLVSNFYAFDTNKSALSIVGNETLASAAYNGAIYAPNGKIYFVPSSETIIRYYDTYSKTIGQVATPTSGGFSTGVLTPQGKIYFIPFVSTQMYILDTKDDSITIHPYPFPGGNSYISGILTPNGRIYMIPHSVPEILYLDITTNAIETAASIPSPSTGMFNGAVLAPNGKIYPIPEGYGNFISFDTKDHTIKTLFPRPAGSYRSGALGPEGEIYLAPHTADRFDLIQTGSLGRFCPSLRLSPYWNKL